jgi:hypothetical protein
MTGGRHSDGRALDGRRFRKFSPFSARALARGRGNLRLKRRRADATAGGDP